METKKCGYCKEMKSIESFPLTKQKDGSYKPYGWCKICKRKKAKTAVRKYNAKNRHKNLIYEQNSRNEKRKIVEEQYRKPCVKCGEDRIYLIEFHHIDPKTKLFAPLNNYQRSLKAIIAEIEKCVTLCCNCHREFHHFERTKGMKLNEYLENGL